METNKWHDREGAAVTNDDVNNVRWRKGGGKAEDKGGEDKRSERYEKRKEAKRGGAGEEKGGKEGGEGEEKGGEW